MSDLLNNPVFANALKSRKRQEDHDTRQHELYEQARAASNVVNEASGFSSRDSLSDDEYVARWAVAVRDAALQIQESGVRDLLADSPGLSDDAQLAREVLREALQSPEQAFAACKFIYQHNLRGVKGGAFHSIGTEFWKRVWARAQMTLREEFPDIYPQAQGEAEPAPTPDDESIPALEADDIQAQLRAAIAELRANENGTDEQGGEGEAPPVDIPDAPQYVTLDQMAALVNRSKKTLERELNRPNSDMPKPDVEGGGGKPHEWRWDRIRPWLATNYARELPVRFPTV